MAAQINTAAAKTTAYTMNGTATSITLPAPADWVNQVLVVAGGETSFSAVAYPVVNTAPAAGQVEFVGVPGAPASTLTFSAAPAANSLVLVEWIPAGAL